MINFCTCAEILACHSLCEPVLDSHPSGWHREVSPCKTPSCNNNHPDSVSYTHSRHTASSVSVLNPLKSPLALSIKWMLWGTHLFLLVFHLCFICVLHQWCFCVFCHFTVKQLSPPSAISATWGKLLRVTVQSKNTVLFLWAINHTLTLQSDFMQAGKKTCTVSVRLKEKKHKHRWSHCSTAMTLCSQCLLLTFRSRQFWPDYSTKFAFIHFISWHFSRLKSGSGTRESQ